MDYIFGFIVIYLIYKVYTSNDSDSQVSFDVAMQEVFSKEENQNFKDKKVFGKIDLIIKYANIIDPSALSEIIRFAKNLYNTLKQQYLTNDEYLREFCHEQLNIIAHATDQPACRDFLSLVRIPKSNYYKDFLRRGENGGLVLNYDTKAGDVMLSKAMQFGDLLHKKYKTDHPMLNSMAVQILILANRIIDLERNSYYEKSDLSYFKF